MGLLKRIGTKLSETPQQSRAQEIRTWAAGIAGVEQMAVCRTRQPVRVAGVVESMKVIPQGNSSQLEVQIYDGTDRIYAVWLGRRRIEGIDLGMGLVLEGMLGRHRGMLQIINPAYTLVSRQ